METSKIIWIIGKLLQKLKNTLIFSPDVLNNGLILVDHLQLVYGKVSTNNTGFWDAEIYKKDSCYIINLANLEPLEMWYLKTIT